MGRALIAYFSTSEKNRPTNEDRVVKELERLFSSAGVSVSCLRLAPKKNLKLSEQFKHERHLELKEAVPPLGGFNYVVIGTPIVGSLNSAPLVNLFIRKLPRAKKAGKRKSHPKQIFSIFSVGVIHGFELKKMQSLLSMKGIQPAHAQAFTSIFDFDHKKLLEVKQFFERAIQRA